MFAALIFVICGLAVSAAIIPNANNAFLPTYLFSDLPLTPRIIGGYGTPFSQMGYVGYVENYDPSMKRGTSCNGCLIAPNVILTAAFCNVINGTVNKNVEDFNVGFFKSSFPTKTFPYSGLKAKQFIPHPDYNSTTYENNLAILILEEDVPPTDATTVKVLTGSYPEKSPALIAGYGITDPDDMKSTPSQLMHINLNLGSKSECKSRNPRFFDPNTMVCVPETSRTGICYGDGGGPVAIKDGNGDYALLGINSWRAYGPNNPLDKCATSGTTGYYTYVNPYVNWISRQAKLDISDFTVAYGSSSTISLDDSSMFVSSLHSDSSIDEGNNNNRSSNKAVIIGAVVGSVGGLLVLILIIYLIYMWRRKWRYASYPTQDNSAQKIPAANINNNNNMSNYNANLNFTPQNYQTNNSGNNHYSQNFGNQPADNQIQEAARNSAPMAMPIPMPPAYQENDPTVVSAEDNKVSEKQ